MPTSYLHPDHLKSCLQPGDFVFCTLAVRDRLSFILKDSFYADERMPAQFADDTKVTVVSGLPDGSIDLDEVAETAIEIASGGCKGAMMIAMRMVDRKATQMEQKALVK